MSETSIVRENLMTKPGYTPFCGNNTPRDQFGGCDNPRTKFDGEQFFCPKCKLRSAYPMDFIKRYKAIWGL